MGFDFIILQDLLTPSLNVPSTSAMCIDIASFLAESIPFP